MAKAFRKWRDLPACAMHPSHLERLNEGGRLNIFFALWRKLGSRSNRYGGLVLDGQPIKLAELARALDMSPRSLKSHLGDLKVCGYIETRPCGPRGVRILVKLWDPGRPAETSPATRFRNDLLAGTVQKAAPDYGGNNRWKKSAPIEENQGKAVSSDSAGQGKKSAPVSEAQIPPLNNPPYKDLRVLLESATTNVVPLYMGRNRVQTPCQPVVDFSKRQAIQSELDKIEKHERPTLTRKINRAFELLALERIDSVFEMAWRMRKTSGWLDNSQGWWASTLVRAAELELKLQKQDQEEDRG